MFAEATGTTSSCRLGGQYKSMLSLSFIDFSLALLKPAKAEEIVMSVATTKIMERRALKTVNNDMNTNIYSYLDTSGSKSFNLYLNVVNFINTSLNWISVAA